MNAQIVVFLNSPLRLTFKAYTYFMHRESRISALLGATVTCQDCIASGTGQDENGAIVE